jgi:hypothetical protein
VRSVGTVVETDLSHPRVDDPSVLSGRYVCGSVEPAWEQIVV